MNAKFFTDEECIGFARYADTQFVGGAQGFEVELAAGIDHAFGLQCKHLELGIMGGSHQQHAAAAQFLNDGNSQSGTFRLWRSAAF